MIGAHPNSNYYLKPSFPRTQRLKSKRFWPPSGLYGVYLGYVPGVCTPWRLARLQPIYVRNEVKRFKKKQQAENFFQTVGISLGQPPSSSPTTILFPIGQRPRRMEPPDGGIHAPYYSDTLADCWDPVATQPSNNKGELSALPGHPVDPCLQISLLPW